MAVAHVATGARGAGANGTGGNAPADYPSGVAAGRLAVACIVRKPETVSATAVWTQQIVATGGTGTTGVDVGPTKIDLQTKVLDGTESGTVNFPLGASPFTSAGIANISIYQCAGDWLLATSAGDDTTHGTGRSATGTTSIALAPGDVVVAFVGSDTDATTAWTSPAITASGITFGATTERLAPGGTNTGNDVGFSIHEATVSSGSGTAAPAISLSSGPSNCGPVAFLRLREEPSRRRRFMQRGVQPMFRAVR